MKKQSEITEIKFAKPDCKDSNQWVMNFFLPFKLFNIDLIDIPKKAIKLTS